jgi:hypothetical protein
MFPVFQVIYAHEWMNDVHDQEMQVQLGKTNTRGVTETVEVLTREGPYQDKTSLGCLRSASKPRTPSLVV